MITFLYREEGKHREVKISRNCLQIRESS